MQIVKKTAEHSILKRRDSRYAVRDARGNPVNGDDKVAVLKAEGLITVSEPKAPEPEPEPEEETAEEATEEGSEESSEESESKE